MRPNTSPLAQQYKCRCGATHAKMFKLFNLNVYECPEVTDDALHFVYLPPPGVSYLITGPEGAAAGFASSLKALSDRITALEALAKRKGKE